MPAAMSWCAFLLEPFHSLKIQPHMVEKMMMEAMCSVHDAKPNPSGSEPPILLWPIE